jgi:hypothetical protein
VRLGLRPLLPQCLREHRQRCTSPLPALPDTGTNRMQGAGTGSRGRSKCGECSLAGNGTTPAARRRRQAVAMHPITFFLDADDATLASWRTLQPDAEPQRLVLGEDYWIVLTHARLRDAGMDVRLANRVPDAGIVVFYAGDKRALWSQLRDRQPVLLAAGAQRPASGRIRRLRDRAERVLRRWRAQPARAALAAARD